MFDIYDFLKNSSQTILKTYHASNYKHRGSQKYASLRGHVFSLSSASGEVCRDRNLFSHFLFTKLIICTYFAYYSFYERVTF